MSGQYGPRTGVYTVGGINRFDWSMRPLHPVENVTELPLDRVTVTLRHSKIHAEDCEACETATGLLDRIERIIAIEGELDPEQRARLMEIADKCPVHKTLTSEIHIVTRAAD